MDWNTSKTIYEQLQTCANDDLKEHFVSLAVRYARLRVDWLLSEGEARSRLDESRTAAHNALISAVNALSRNMDQDGLDISWRKTLGSDRRVIGDFACYLHCILGISAR